MAVSLRMNGTQIQCIAALNALQPSNFPGQAAQLTRAVTAAIAEINSFAVGPTPRGKFELVFDCHRDSITSVILIRVSPGVLNSANEVIALNATGNDTEQ